MTTKCTSPVNGGAMSKFDRKAIMVRAWAIFRETYKYPQIKSSSIGRACFGWALREAWAEAKEAARVAAIPATEKAARIAVLNRTIELASYSESWPQASREISAARAEITLLSQPAIASEAITNGSGGDISEHDETELSIWRGCCRCSAGRCNGAVG